MKWIKCEDQMPKIHDRALILFAPDGRPGDQIMKVAMWKGIAEGFGLEDSFDSGYDMWHVTHWMPLPDVPEEE